MSRWFDWVLASLLCFHVCAGAQSIAPPTHPTLAAQSSINTADTAWMLTSTALVLLMTLPGIALFYGGIVGSLLTGVLDSKSISGVQGTLSTQLAGVVIVVLYSALMSGLLLWLTRVWVGLRVDEASEQTGLDISLHREQLGT